MRCSNMDVDLSRFKATEEALRASQSFLRLVLDTIPVRVFWKDTQSRYLGCNRAYANDAGLPTTAAITGLLDEDLPWTANAELYRADDRTVMRDGGRARIDVERPLVDARGVQHWLETTKVPLLDAQGAVIGVLGTFHDITERHQKLRELNTLAAAFTTGTGPRLLMALAKAAAELSGARWAFVAKLTDDGTQAVITASYPPEFADQGLIYPLRGTPCEYAKHDGVYLVQSGVQSAYPDDEMLTALDVQAYAGRCLQDNEGRAIGLLVLLHDQALPETATLRSVLELIAINANAEFAREQRERELIKQRQRLDIALASGQQGLWEWDLAGDKLTSLETGHGSEVDRLLPSSGAVLWAQVEPAGRRLLKQTLVAYLRGRHAIFEQEVCVRLADDTARWVLLRGKTVEFDTQGKALRMTGTHTDVTSMKTAEIALEQARHFLGTVIDTIPQAVYWKDQDSRYLGCNKTYANLAGLRDPSEIEGLTDRELPWQALALRILGEDGDILSGRQAHITTQDCVSNSPAEDVWLEKHKVPFRGPDGRIMGILGTTHDITARKRAEAEIEQLVYFDPLTHLPNRRYFKDRLEAALALARRHESAGALLYLDIDHFKKINDTLGHPMGDRLLVDVGARIKGPLRKEDVVARIGGDEFVIILGNLSVDPQHCAQQARAVAHKIRRDLSRPFVIDDHELYVTCTTGIAVFPEHHDSTDELLKMADAAMYRGKTEGRNTVFFFDPELLAEAKDRLHIETLLRNAIDRGELSLHYQPQVDAKGNLVGAEALMRWHHPVLGNVSPARFIPIAEEAGLIDELGLWAIKEALAALARWHAAGIAGHHLAVNVSQRQFSSPRFVQDVIEALGVAVVPRGSLALELTESAAAEHVEDTIAKMKQLQAAGVSFAIDDFGVGYSSLCYLAQLPIQQLKIDRSFIIDVEHDRTKSAIIATLLTLGENLGLTVVAEGVETLAQWQHLVARGCCIFQGYLLSHPLAEADFIAFAHTCARHFGQNSERTLQHIA